MARWDALCLLALLAGCTESTLPVTLEVDSVGVSGPVEYCCTSSGDYYSDIECPGTDVYRVRLNVATGDGGLLGQDDRWRLRWDGGRRTGVALAEAWQPAASEGWQVALATCRPAGQRAIDLVELLSSDDRVIGRVRVYA